MADGRNLEKVKELAAYRVSEEMYVEEMDSRAMVLEHIKSGARIFLMSNEDENKVFYIGFRTPPDDSTGLPHILEHSVLEGSDKFPVKDPFVELVKGSLNTFLNAMTYSSACLRRRPESWRESSSWSREPFTLTSWRAEPRQPR